MVRLKMRFRRLPRVVHRRVAPIIKGMSLLGIGFRPGGFESPILQLEPF
jgi:hypothetical protein